MYVHPAERNKFFKDTLRMEKRFCCCHATKSFWEDWISYGQILIILKKAEKDVKSNHSGPSTSKLYFCSNSYEVTLNGSSDESLHFSFRDFHGEVLKDLDLGLSSSIVLADIIALDGLLADIVTRFNHHREILLEKKNMKKGGLGKITGFDSWNSLSVKADILIICRLQWQNKSA